MTNVQPLRLGVALAYVVVQGKRYDVMPTKDYVDAFNGLLQRTGGAYNDLIAEISAVAQQAQSSAASAAVAAVAAYDAGAPTSYALDPAAPITTSATSGTTASVFVAAHTRTPGGGAPIALDAGTVEIDRGIAYSIYYMDPTDVGGAVTYLATTDAAIAGDYASGARIVGSAYLPVGGSVWQSGNGGTATP